MLLKSSKSFVFDAAILNEFPFCCFKGLPISKPLFVYALQSGFYEVLKPTSYPHKAVFQMNTSPRKTING